MQITYLQLWAMVLFVMQCVLFFLPASVEWWMRWAPVLVVCALVAVSIAGSIILFIYHVVRGFRRELKRRKELITMPEKE